MTQTTTAKRPATVTILTVLVVLAALVHLLAAVAAIFLIIRPGDVQQFFGAPVSDWYWVLSAVLSFILALIYFWIASMLLTGNPQGWLLVNVLAVINIIFALFSVPLGTGWAQLGLNVIVLLLNNVASSRAWFRLENLQQPGGPSAVA